MHEQDKFELVARTSAPIKIVVEDENDGTLLCMEVGRVRAFSDRSQLLFARSKQDEPYFTKVLPEDVYDIPSLTDRGFILTPGCIHWKDGNDV